MPSASCPLDDARILRPPRMVRLLGTICLGLAAGPLAAQVDELHGDVVPPTNIELHQASLPRVRPQVPFASAVEDEVVVYGQRETLGLPNSVRAELWRSQRRELQAMMIERERLSSKVPLEAFDALLGTRLRVRLLPVYDPMSERRLEYRINDSMPVGLIDLFCMAFGRNDEFTDVWNDD